VIENRDATANYRNTLLVKDAATDPNSYIAKFESGGVNRTTLRADALLAVNGSIAASGTIVGAVYQDVAEWVPATTKIEPGTVVVLNPDHNNEAMPSGDAYDTRVAGVASANLACSSARGATSQAMIAATGRVRVHIRRHDASDPHRRSPRHQRQERRSTAASSISRVRFIGKALEPLAGGRGDILVLLQ